MVIWTIEKLECLTDYNNTPNVVESIFWNVEASRVVESNTISTSLKGKTRITISEGPFIPFDELTEQTVINWLYNKLGDVKLTIETGLELKLDDIQAPQKSTLTPPWE